MSHHKKKILNLKRAGVFIFVLLAIFALAHFISKREKKNKILPEVTVPPVVENIVATSTDKVSVDVSKLELLGSSKISFAGGTAGRQKNIEIGLSKLNDTVVMPGQVFSFKDTLGTTTVDMGYSFEKQFLNGEVTKGLGGGLCQVSTTLFRSILSAGLPVVERSNHSFSVSYYDVGLDATYSDPGPDLKFKNDTANPIVIKGKTVDSSAVFEIYGVKDGRVASTSEAEITNIVDVPVTRYVYVDELEKDHNKCMNTPQIGYTAKVVYGVQYPDGTYKEKDFVSRYKPLQRVCYIVGDEIKTFDINKVLGKK